jgi:hypothetical protein
MKGCRCCCCCGGGGGGGHHTARERLNMTGQDRAGRLRLRVPPPVKGKHGEAKPDEGSQRRGRPGGALQRRQLQGQALQGAPQAAQQAHRA